MDIHIRNMEKKDIGSVQAVAKASWKATYEKVIPSDIQERFLQSAYNDDMMLKRMEISSLYVAEQGGEIIGFANFSAVKQNGDAELGAIYLLPEHQGAGIGTALLQQGLKNLDGAKALFISVEKENRVGVDFYLAKGFQMQYEFDDDLDGHVSRMIRMSLDLTSVSSTK